MDGLIIAGLAFLATLFCCWKWLREPNFEVIYKDEFPTVETKRPHGWPEEPNA